MNNGNSSFRLFPNPSTDQITVEYYPEETGFFHPGLDDVTGREAAVFLHTMKKRGNHRVTCNAAAIPDGMYFLQFHHGKSFESVKIIVRKM